MPGGICDGAQSFIDDLPGEVDVGPVLEVDDHLREAEFRDGADQLEPGQSAQHLLDGKGDLLLDLLGAERRGHAVDLDLHRRRVGESVNIQVPHRHHPEDGKGCGPKDHQQAVSQRKVDNPVQHRLVLPCRAFTSCSRHTLHRGCL